MNLDLNQRYYIFLALSKNETFLHKIRSLREVFGKLEKPFPTDGFDNKEEADSWLSWVDNQYKEEVSQWSPEQHAKTLSTDSSKQKLDAKTIFTTYHPMIAIENELNSLLKMFGVPTDQMVYKTLLHFFFFDEIALVSEKYRLSWIPTDQVVTVSLYAETKMQDIQNDLDKIFQFKKKYLKTKRKSKRDNFYRDLEFYKLYQWATKNKKITLDNAIELIYKIYGESDDISKIREILESNEGVFLDRDFAYVVIRRMKKLLGSTRFCEDNEFESTAEFPNKKT